MAVITMDELKVRYVTNRRIQDKSARDADWQVLLADTAESFGADKVNLAFEQAILNLNDVD